MNNNNKIWEDRVIKFDVPNIHNKLRGGEKILDILHFIEDTKGNLGDDGSLLVTNLRLIWYSLTTTKFNLSIGYLNMVSMNIKTVVSKTRGTTQALYIMTVSGNSKFEFIFTNTNGNSLDPFPSIFEIYRLYQGSQLYREMKLRSAIISGGQLKLLSQEQCFTRLDNVLNLSSDQGNMGTFIITNIRIVWFADMNETFNISLPFVQIATVRIRESKYGPALVLQTCESGGSYILGFRIDPHERLQEVYRELVSLYTVYSEKPILGVVYEAKETTKMKPDEPTIDDIEELDTSRASEINSNFSAYLSEGDSGIQRREPFYCQELGFAMEKLKDGYTLKDLWEVIPSGK